MMLSMVVESPKQQNHIRRGEVIVCRGCHLMGEEAVQLTASVPQLPLVIPKRDDCNVETSYQGTNCHID
jgi:hypothetical protein